MRSVLAVIVGYAIFAISAGLWFQLTGQAPHTDAAISFQLATLLYGALFSLSGGFITQLIAKTNSTKVNIALMIVMLVLALTSLLLSSGNHWTQWMTIVVFAPLALFGGYIRRRSHNKIQ